MSPPSRCSISTFAAALATRNEPLAITLCCRSQSATVVSSRALDSDRPALFTTRSKPPKASTAALIAACTASSSVTSAAIPMALSSLPISAAAAAAFSASRSAITTQAPSAASRWAMALPIPEAAPVTSAIRVANGLGFGIRCSLASSSAQYSILNFSDSSIGAYVERPSAPRITLIALT